LPLLFFNAYHAPNAVGVVDCAAGFSDGDRPLVFVDPAVNLPAALSEQTQKVGGLAGIRLRSRHSSEVIDISGRPVNRHRRCGLPFTDIIRPGAGHAAAASTRALITRAIRQALSDGLRKLRRLGVF
jgi:hypothetical protein